MTKFWISFFFSDMTCEISLAKLNSMGGTRDVIERFPVGGEKWNATGSLFTKRRTETLPEYTIKTSGAATVTTPDHLKDDSLQGDPGFYRRVHGRGRETRHDREHIVWNNIQNATRIQGYVKEIPRAAVAVKTVERSQGGHHRSIPKRSGQIRWQNQGHRMVSKASLNRKFHFQCHQSDLAIVEQLELETSHA